MISSLGMLLVPTISHELQVEMSTGQWMLTVNVLVGAISTPIMGRLSDCPHKKLLLLASLGFILSDLFSFRFAFWFAALFLMAMTVAWRVVPDGPDDLAPRGPFDMPGALLVGTKDGERPSQQFPDSLLA